MPRSREELLAALLKYPRGSENTLTELFATVLEAHAGFARLLFERAGIELPDDGIRFETHTQRRVAPGRIPDMFVSAYVQDHLHAQLWSEHKTGSGFRDLQLEDYLDSLHSKPFAGALIAIVASPDAEREGSDWKLLTWQEVAELANRAGRGWQEHGWRRVALNPDAPARERLLHEFIWYLEEEGYAVVDALDRDNVLAFRKSAETSTGLATLLERAGEHMRGTFEPTELDGYEEGSAYWQLFRLPPDAWPSRFHTAGWDVYLELHAGAADEWSEDATAQPAFGAGVTLAGELYEDIAADADWVAELREGGLALALYDEYTRIYGTLPMTDLVATGDTLDEQARALAKWASATLSASLQHAPRDDYVVRPKPGRREPKRPSAEFVTQPVTETDIRHGRVRVPRDGAKGLFPSEPGDVRIVLRGTELSAGWNPRYGRRSASGERSGQLRVGHTALDEAVETGERLTLTRDGDAVHLD